MRWFRIQNASDVVDVAVQTIFATACLILFHVQKSIREILSKVVGRELVNENRPYVYETVDKIVGNYVEAAADAAAAAELIR